MQAEMEALADELRAKGRKPYVISGGGSNPVGALGYVNAALELVNQPAEMSLRIDHVVHATGSAGTQAGLVTGLVALNSNVPVLGIGVRAPREKQEANVLSLAQRTAAHVSLPNLVQPRHVAANCDYVGQGYGIPTKGMVEAVRMLAEKEGILLDPVYSGKAMAGFWGCSATRMRLACRQADRKRPALWSGIHERRGDDPGMIPRSGRGRQHGGRSRDVAGEGHGLRERRRALLAEAQEIEADRATIGHRIVLL